MASKVKKNNIVRIPVLKIQPELADIQLDDNYPMTDLRRKRQQPENKRMMRSDHYFKELHTSETNELKWSDELYASRIATLSMMEDAVEAKKTLELTNKKLLDEIAERTRSEKIQQVLYAVSNAVLTDNNLDGLINIFKDQLGTLIDTTNFYLAFYDETTGMLSATNVSDEYDSIESWPAEKSLTGLVINKNKPILVTIDKINELNDKGIIKMIGTCPQVWMGVPLLVDGKATGAFAVQNYHNKNAFTKKDLEMLEFISNQISIFIQRKKSVQELKEALKKAEENDRLKSAFLHNISHEIRTPMNAIIGFSGFLNDPDLKPDMLREYTEIISNASNQLLSVIEDIINISTLEVGQEIITTKETNLNKLLKNLYKQFYAKNQNPNIEFLLAAPLSDESACILTDETKLLQILTNLLNNASKFTKKGRISFGYELKESNLEFYVKDTGIGIKREVHDAIFERFRQADGSIAREFGGTGLGLSISKAYVELMGGKIWLDSLVGEGSSFYFTIPYKPIKIELHKIKIQKDVKIVPSANQKVVLIAEDEKFNYLLLEELFKEMNVKIIWAKNGWEAINACYENSDIDLVMMDMKMPIMDGFEATRILRGTFTHIPIIAQTAYASEKDLQRVYDCGCNEVITKPIDVNKFNRVINKFLNQDKND
jgi:signal transduction histidine kinase/ActR/RegA family two-component response regulator